MISKLTQAEIEGYDAIAIGCYDDLGLYEEREIIDIPIAGASETSMHFACMLGEKFAVITYLEKLTTLYNQLFRKYGLQDRAVSPVFMKLKSLNDLINGLENPEPIIEKFVDAAKKP